MAVPVSLVLSALQDSLESQRKRANKPTTEAVTFNDLHYALEEAREYVESYAHDDYMGEDQ
jgi:hypothetical protein